MTAPLRFLGIALGGWVCVRAAMLAPDWPQAEPPGRAEPQRQAVGKAAPSQFAAGTAAASPASAEAELPAQMAVTASSFAAAPAPKAVAALLLAPALPLPVPRHIVEPAPEAAPLAATLPPLATTSVGRWSVSAWAFARGGEGRQLGAAGMLGGSQLGIRGGYRLNGNAARPLSVQLRAYSPAGDISAAEAAVGIEWQPARLPVRLLGERRQALGKPGRSAFAVMAHGGVSGVQAGPLSIEAYGQSGVVGLKSRDLFAEGALAAGISRGAVTIGGGVWGGAQPGVARLDLGPRLSIRLPGAARNLRVTADWRVRVAGDAAPGSGPALTIGGDF